MKKQPKKICSFRLCEQTRQQLENMVDEEMNAAEVIEYTINKIYNTDYRVKNPNLPNIKINKYSIE